VWRHPRQPPLQHRRRRGLLQQFNRITPGALIPDTVPYPVSARRLVIMPSMLDKTVHHHVATSDPHRSSQAEKAGCTCV
jgi:hypothetical protein